jgi:hypothetical protein
MPYIKQKEREDIDHYGSPKNSGQLNYIITRYIDEYLGKNPKYDDYNSAMGVLTCAQLELYRRRVAGYEDKKKEENGDVYTV